MVRIRHGWFVVVLGLGLAFVTACKKDDSAADKAGGKGGQSGKSGKSSSGEDLSLLPVDSEVVLGINVAQVQQSALWKQFVEPKLVSGEAQKKLAEFKDKCGFDPMTSVKTVSVGLKVVGNKPDGAVVLHGIDQAKTWACIDKMKDEMARDGTEFSRDGDVGLLKSKTGDQTAFMFVNDSTVLGVLGDKANAAGVKGFAASSSALKTSPAFVDMYGKINAGDSVWFVVNGKLLDKAPLPVKPKALFGSVNVTDGLKLDLRMRLESPDAATQFANLAKGQAQQAAKMFDQIDVTSEGTEVKFSIVLSNQKLQDLVKQFAGMAGMLGGMGGP
ncbi:MAG TPA: hypothetical protein VHN14_11645 [Kofleriaceae bacterium]|jgi:hypothetical protein|nr:hypothetical protein [Kofleriaceae bacterium]